jgi:hypothetical protein
VPAQEGKGSDATFNDPAGPPATGVVAGFTVASPAVQMNIVAHEDDDFLFINPDLVNQISAGVSLVTVYVTAGEANGDSRCGPTEGTNPGSQDEHANERQRAVRAAYAQMTNPSWTAAQADNAAWTRELIVPDPEVAWPHTVERYTLVSNPGIRLIFMNLREDGDGDKYDPVANPGGSPTIGQMFADHSLVTNTVVPSCGPAGSCVHVPSCGPDVPWQNYTYDQLVTVLSDLVAMYQPVVVRTLDPLPLELPGRDNLCRSANYYEDVCFDNLDHTTVARYVDQVMSTYHGPNATGRFTLVHYKGYSHTNYPNNVGNGSFNQKRAAGEAYRQASVLNVLGQPMVDDPFYSDAGYLPDYQSMYERYPGSTEWLKRANNGRLVAVAVEGRRVKLWYENSVGGTWTGPVNLGGGGPIAPHLTLLVRPDGRLQIFATRLPLGLEQSPSVGAAQEVITAIQISNTMTFSAWRSVGAPDSGTATGVATAAVDGNGRTFVFARDSLGRVAYTYSVGSSWAAWTSIEQPDVMDGFAAITRDDGVVELFATARAGWIQRYVQSGTTFAMSPASVFYFDGAAGPPTVTKNRDGRLEIFYREETSIAVGSPYYGRVRTAWVNTAGTWSGPAYLYGDAGGGPIAAIRRGGTGEIMLFERNTWNGLSTTRQYDPNGPFILQWNLRNGLLEEYPAAATDGLGRVVVVVKGSDGKLYYQRESSASAIGDFGGWTIAGN